MSKIGRNKLCPCGSGRKNKKCCGPDAVEGAVFPGLAEQFNEQGNACADQDRFADAVRCYEQALSINPNFAGAWNNLGITYKDLSQFDRAIDCYRRALDLAPGFGGAWNNLGNALKMLTRHEEALHCYRRALELVPDSASVYNNLGNTSDEFGNYSEAIVYYRMALQFEPDLADAFCGMGGALVKHGMYNDAMDCFQRAIALRPDNDKAYNVLMMSRQYEFSITNDDIFAAARQYAGKFEVPLRSEWGSVERRLQLDGRLKVGLVSADLRHHPVGYFLEAVLGHLDKNAFALVAYANQNMDDSLSERIRPCFDKWVNVCSLTDAQLADRIRGDNIDLLLDLSGHTGGNRLLTFARKPAPVQATWLGFANTTGLESMDYIIADNVTIPPEEEPFYTENVWRLPETYVCFTPPDVDVTISNLPAVVNGHITFGCFNNPAKINDAVVACWADILEAVPDSVLLLKNKNYDHEVERKFMFQRFHSRGIDPLRVRFVGASPRGEYLAAYREVDFCLDPFPYSGLTTTCEALWMGVPTLTLRMARGMFGHHGELVMKSVGLDGWVAGSLEEYRQRAIAFASNPDRLASLRRTLRQALLCSPLCAPDRFARNLEEAFRGMLRTSTGDGLQETP